MKRKVEETAVAVVVVAVVSVIRNSFKLRKNFFYFLIS